MSPAHYGAGFHVQLDSDPMVLVDIDWEDDAVMLEAASGTASHIGKITWPSIASSLLSSYAERLFPGRAVCM